MLVFDAVSLTPNPATISAAFLVAVTVHEETASWQDAQAVTWSTIKGAQPNDWEQVRDKYF